MIDRVIEYVDCCVVGCQRRWYVITVMDHGHMTDKHRATASQSLQLAIITAACETQIDAQCRTPRFALSLAAATCG
jgi:hypothetical protein